MNIQVISKPSERLLSHKYEIENCCVIMKI
jgi:hypothetical protein